MPKDTNKSEILYFALNVFGANILAPLLSEANKIVPIETKENKTKP